MIYFSAKSLFLKKIFFLILVSSAGFLNGCSSQSGAVWKTLQIGFSDVSSQIEKSPLQNNLTYLRANINGLDVLLAKGYTDLNSRGPVDVWYSSDGAIMRIQEGRYLGSIGFDQNWNEVSRSDAPSLIMILNRETAPDSKDSLAPIKSVKKYFSTQSYTHKPSYLVMDGERVSSSLSANMFGSIPDSIPNSLKKYLKNKDFIWVIETPQPNDIFKKKGASFAWYGFVKKNGTFEQVIGQQCLSKDFCVTWMPWPIQP